MMPRYAAFGSRGEILLSDGKPTVQIFFHHAAFGSRGEILLSDGKLTVQIFLHHAAFGSSRETLVSDGKPTAQRSSFIMLHLVHMAKSC